MVLGFQDCLAVALYLLPPLRALLLRGYVLFLRTLQVDPFALVASLLERSLALFVLLLLVKKNRKPCLLKNSLLYCVFFLGLELVARRRRVTQLLHRVFFLKPVRSFVSLIGSEAAW